MKIDCNLYHDGERIDLTIDSSDIKLVSYDYDAEFIRGLKELFNAGDCPIKAVFYLHKQDHQDMYLSKASFPSPAILRDWVLKNLKTSSMTHELNYLKTTM